MSVRRLVLVATVLGGFVLGACGSDRPNAGSGAGSTVENKYCGTPNSGCPCDTPGQTVACGQVHHTGPDGWVACQMGKRTCEGGTWGVCYGEEDVRTKRLVIGGGLSTSSLSPLALGSSAPCPATGPTSNPCDPYCNQYIDDPGGLLLDAGGGISVVDGGLTIDPNATGDGGASTGGFTSTAAGVSGCSPNRNIVGPACTPPGLATCQQDFRCDPSTSQCLWNGGPGYFDASAGGVDLTVGAPCGPQGAATSTVPVCNRGSVGLGAGATIAFHRTTGPTPPDSCTNLGAPDSTFVLGTPLAPGACTSFQVANSTGAKFITVNAGVPGAQPVNEAAGRCANNSAYWRTDGSAGDCALCNNACQTRLTGTIYDPRGVNPLPSVLVFVPSTTQGPLTDGVACDTCVNLITGTPFSQTVTGFDGKFTLDVPPGGNFPLVIQVGRWRRIVTVPAVTGCTTATLSTALSRLPRNKAEGNIPKMALTMAQGDHLECLMRKVGIDDAEFTAGGGTGRVHLYSHNGMTFGGATNGPTNLWDNAANLNSYSAIIAPCDNNHLPQPQVQPNYTAPPPPTATASQRANMKAYLDAGGRLFASHWFSLDFVYYNYPTAVTHLFGQRVESDREAPSIDYTIDTSFPSGQTFADWANLVGASPSYGKVRFNSWRHLSESVAAPTRRFAYGDSRLPPVNRTQAPAPATTIWGGPMVGIYSFDTPYGAANTCGRVVVPMSHVSSGSGAFPAGCGAATTAMSAQEKAFEFLLFESQACIGPPPAPPMPPPLPTVTFYRDYEGVCTPGYVPVWQPFYWQSLVPAGTSIEFHAGTATTQALLPPTATSPSVKAVGTAGATVASPQWDCDGCPAAPKTVDFHLRNDPPPPNDQSRQWLRVFFTFNPNNAVVPHTAPVLTAWRQVYDCIPYE